MLRAVVRVHLCAKGGELRESENAMGTPAIWKRIVSSSYSLGPESQRCARGAQPGPTVKSSGSISLEALGSRLERCSSHPTSLEGARLDLGTGEAEGG
jgi:hypothetical protein